MKQKAHEQPESIEVQGLPATAGRQVQTLKPESGADCHALNRPSGTRSCFVAWFPGIPLRCMPG